MSQPAGPANHAHDVATLRGLAADGTIAGRFDRPEPAPRMGLDARTDAIARLAALITLGAPAAAYRTTVDAARATGATDDEIIDLLRAVAPTIGLVRLVRAVNGLALAVGYDVDAALENLDT